MRTFCSGNDAQARYENNLLNLPKYKKDLLRK